MAFTPLPKFPDTGNVQIDELLEPLYRTVASIIATLSEEFEYLPLSPGRYEFYLDSPLLTFFPERFHRLVCVAAESLSYGTIINIYEDAGIVKARKAASSAVPADNYFAHGYVETSSTISPGDAIECKLYMGKIGITGIVPGEVYYLSETPGLVTTTRPTGGGIVQIVGIGIATNLLYFVYSPPVDRYDLSGHLANPDPHTQYQLEADLGTAAFSDSTDFAPASAISDHVALSNPHTQYQLTSGLGTAAFQSGLSVTISLAKLTAGGTDGSLTFTFGVLTSKVDPT